MHPSKRVALSIIIVNYNGLKFLGPCFSSISQFVLIPHEIILVDNASTDKSLDYIRQHHSEVKLIQSPVNVGFAGGNNLGARHANGDYLLLLNSDAIILSDVSPLIEMMKNDPDIGALGCRLLYANGRQQESAGNVPNVIHLILSWTPLAWFFQSFRRSISGNSDFYYQKKAEVGWVSGAFLMTPKNIWCRLMGMDENYFMYMEDTDYCRRVCSLNKKVVYSSIGKVTHFEGAGRPWLGEKAILYTVSSYMTYVKKFYGEWHTFLLQFLLAPIFFSRGLVCFALALFGLDPHGVEKFNAYRRAAYNLILAPRRSCGGVKKI